MCFYSKVNSLKSSLILYVFGEMVEKYMILLPKDTTDLKKKKKKKKKETDKRIYCGNITARICQLHWNK